MTLYPRDTGSPTAPLSQLQLCGSAPLAARVMGCLDLQSSPCPLLACIHLIRISVRHVWDWTANVVVAGKTTFTGVFWFFFFALDAFYIFHVSSPPHSKKRLSF